MGQQFFILLSQSQAVSLLFLIHHPNIVHCLNAFSGFLFLLAQRLIVCLLAEVGKGKSSSWYLYLSQLPSYYTVLATFNDFEIEALQV